MPRWCQHDLTAWFDPMEAPVTHRPTTSDAGPILIVHLQDTMHRMLREVFGIEGYTAQGTKSGEVALRLLRAAEGGMIVYLEVLCLRMRGNEQLHDYIMNREEHAPHVLVLFTGSMFTKEDMKRLRADS